MDIKHANPNTVAFMAKDVNDYVDAEGALVKNCNMPSVMVRTESDLEDLPSSAYPPGSIAFTAGMGSVWQKDADGEWQAFS